MRKLITFIPGESMNGGQAYAFDENGDGVVLEWGFFGVLDPSGKKTADHDDNFIKVNGEICRASGIHFSMEGIVFWAEPVGAGTVAAHR